jgi:hypothetical protein
MIKMGRTERTRILRDREENAMLRTVTCTVIVHPIVYRLLRRTREIGLCIVEILLFDVLADLAQKTT